MPDGVESETTLTEDPGPEARPTGAAAVVAHALREPGTLQRLLCATLAWTVTVLPVAFSAASPIAARVFASLALTAALVGPALAVRRRHVGRYVGITGFLLLSTATWLLARQSLDPLRIDTIRAAIGAVAWGVYALSWGEPWTAFGAPDKNEKKPDADQQPAAPLRARAKLAPAAVPIASVGAIAAVALMIFVWQIRDASRSLIAQVLGVAVCVGLVSGSATLAIARGKPRAAAERRVNSRVVRALILLVFFAVAGAVILAVRK
ncbi:MAG: hypothetical protein U0414_33330 [Polyangiaceae bacterium]